MRVSAGELPHKMKEVMDTLDRNEQVTLLYRGKERAVIVPAEDKRWKRISAAEHPACGMWKDRDDLKDVPGFVRRIRGTQKKARKNLGCRNN